MMLPVGNTKGGVGKTTLAVQIALSWAIAGRDVLLVDADRQGSAGLVVAVRAEAGRTPGPWQGFVRDPHTRAFDAGAGLGGRA